MAGVAPTRCILCNTGVCEDVKSSSIVSRGNLGERIEDRWRIGIGQIETVCVGLGWGDESVKEGKI